MLNVHSVPVVSVLMPAYNHAPYVRAAVESVLGQTYGNLELIVIDDASTDETWTVLQSFRDERLHLFRHDANQGAHATLNELVGLASGRYFAILNSDDIYHSERLARLVAEAERSNGKCALIFTDVSFVNAQGLAVEGHPRALGYKALSERCATLPPDIRLLTGNLTLSTSNFFVSRTLAERVGAFAPLRYTHDWDWALRASIHGRLTWVREPLLSYRVHDANTLSEDDSWRHIHENSYIQAKALLALGRGMEKHEEPVAATRFACLALLENESFHPLALSLYLTCLLGGVDDRDMLALSCTRDGNWMLRELADAASCPSSLFRSIGHLAESENVITSQQALIKERWSVIQGMREEITKRDECITSQTALIQERWQVIQHLSSDIAHRDEAILAQKSLIEERWNIIQGMGEEIAKRDECITSQTALIQERWQVIQHLSSEIAHRDEAILAQKSLIEERWDAMQVMQLEIGARDRSIDELRGALDALKSSRLVKIALRIRRLMGAAGRYEK